MIATMKRGLGFAWDAAFGSVEKRRIGRHAILTKLARTQGFDLFNQHNFWLEDPDYLRVWAEFAENDGRATERRYNLYFLARAVQNIPGDTAECGVFRGAGSFLIMRATQGSDADIASNKTHLIFDSFEGLSEPDEKDIAEGASDSYWRKNDLSPQEDVVSKHLAQAGRFEFFKGWIPQRFDDVVGRTFRFVHLDVDLYQPTIDSLRFFYERVSPGGYIVCDDYGSRLCPGAKRAVDEFFSDKPENVVSLSSGQSLVVKL